MNKKVDHEKFMEVALKSAKEGIRRNEGGPFGACITRHGKIIAFAHNTVLVDKDPTCHAEINAIRIACRVLNTPFLRDCTVYSTTEPCPMCFSAIHWAQCKDIVYGTPISAVKELGFNELSISNKQMIAIGHSPVTITATGVSFGRCLSMLFRWSVLDGETY